MIYLGSHVSMKAPEYFLGAVKEALSYDANALMLYTGPPQNSKRVDMEKMMIEEGLALLKEHQIEAKRVIVHAPYIINLANIINPDTSQFGAEFLLKELQRVDKLHAKYLILHPGSHLKASLDEGISSIAQKLNWVLEQDDSEVCITLETMAGKGTEIGRTFEELAEIYQRVNRKEKIRFCMDTCHIHDAGYDLDHFDQVLDEFDHVLGLENLGCIHINDSKNEKGAHKDRHANIDRGYIGLKNLAYVVHHPLLKDVTKILETPWIDGKAPYKEEIAALRKVDQL